MSAMVPSNQIPNATSTAKKAEHYRVLNVAVALLRRLRRVLASLGHLAIGG
jgi:hypothetical protein